MAGENEPAEDLRRQQATQIHAAIGRYVESFERTVFDLREQCIFMTCLNTTPKKYQSQYKLMNVVFHHRSMTAENLWRIFEGMTAEIANDRDTDLSDEVREAILGVSSAVDRCFTRMFNNRNDYMHATWFIGVGDSAKGDWTKPVFIRKKVSKGLRYVPGPSDFKAIDECSAQCKHTREIFLSFAMSLVHELTPRGKGTMLRRFKKSGRQKNSPWERVPRRS